MDDNKFSDSFALSVSIKTKLFLVILLTSSLIALVASYLIYSEMYEALLEDVRSELAAIARTAAISVDGNKHRMLELSGDENSALYRELKEQLKEIKQANAKVRYVYTVTRTKKPGTWQFIVDAEENPKLVSHLGDTFKLSDYPDMKSAFLGPVADRELNTDKWGTWLSGYAPIYDKSGKAVAVLGIDMSAQDIHSRLSKSQKDLLIPTLILLILPAIMGLLVSKSAVGSLVSMVATAKKIANGNYDQRIEIKTNDEIGELASALNDMADSIRQRVGSAECMVMIDNLTNLYNHRYFQDRLDEEIKRSERHGREFALIIVDIDDFSEFNINNGHARGDSALQEIAQLIKKSSRDTDIAARYAGEEFAVLLPETGEDEASMVAERISTLVSVHQFPTRYNIAIPLTVSVGVACYPKHGESDQSITEAAFKALAKAKSLGAGQTAVYAVSDGVDPASTQDGGSSRPSLSEKLKTSETTDDLLLNAIFSLAKAVDARDRYTRRHSEFVARYSAALGRAIGLSEQEITNLSIAGLLHDIGKIGIPDSLLNKPEALTQEEWMYMNRHPILGAEIIRNMKNLSRDIVKTVLHHHEQYDGHGYPDGMRREEIPLMARILAVVDSYHAMISDRPYRQGLSYDEAISELLRCRGTQFDPQIVSKFIELIENEQLILDGRNRKSPDKPGPPENTENLEAI